MQLFLEASSRAYEQNHQEQNKTKTKTKNFDRLRFNLFFFNLVELYEVADILL